jgi:hypothetical protein
MSKNPKSTRSVRELLRAIEDGRICHTPLPEGLRVDAQYGFRSPGFNYSGLFFGTSSVLGT